MDVVRFGLSIRALRRRRGWTQRDLGARCRCSGSQISRIERGAAERASIALLERILSALCARLLVRALWQGEELDRLLDRDHAGLVEVVIRLLGASGWAATPEVTFMIRGERGSIDVLAWHASTRTLLVVEVKSVVPDVQGMLSALDRKVRLAPIVAMDRGWQTRAVAQLLVLPADRTSRRRIDRFAATFDRALPARTVAIKHWLAAPMEAMAGVLFLSDLPPAQARQRIRARGRPAVHEGVRAS